MWGGGIRNKNENFGRLWDKVSNTYKGKFITVFKSLKINLGETFQGPEQGDSKDINTTPDSTAHSGGTSIKILNDFFK